MKITLSEIKKMVREELLKEAEEKQAGDLTTFINNIKEMLGKDLKNKFDYNNILALIELYASYREDQKAKKLLDSEGNIDPDKMKQFLNILRGEVADQPVYGGASREELNKELQMESKRRNRFLR